MHEYRTWLDKGNVTAERAKRALPILIRQARAEKPLTYEDLGIELGMHHRPVKTVAAYVGFTLSAIGRTHGWKRRAPPPLQSLIVNGITGLPGHGFDNFLGPTYQKAKSKSQRLAILKAVYAETASYGNWDELLELLQLDPAPMELDEIVASAAKSRGRGGEGPDHRALKEYVAANPALVGLREDHALGELEYGLASGDKVDVVFTDRRRKTAVEVKSRISSDGDVARGLFQCLKYRVVLEAQSALSEKPFNVSVALILGRDFPAALIPLRNSLGIEVIEGIQPE